MQQQTQCFSKVFALITAVSYFEIYVIFQNKKNHKKGERL